MPAFVPIVTALFLVAVGWNHSATMTTRVVIGRPKILLLGDSLTQLSWNGWGAALADVYQRRADVVNRGMSGYNTDWYLRYATSEASDVWTQGPQVTLITIFFGANDASDPILNPRHYVPLHKFSQNLEALISLCSQHYPTAKIVILSAPPVVHAQRLEYQRIRYGDQATGELERTLEGAERYAAAAMDVAEAHSLLGIHLWSLMQQSPGWETYFNDGLHFSKEGNDMVAKCILQHLAKRYPSLTVTPCPLTGQWANSATVCPDLLPDGPYHDDIHHENPNMAFESTSK